MKKILFSLIAIYTFSIANAQEEEVTVSPILSKKGENYLPQIDDWAISFNADQIFEFVGNAFNNDADNRAPQLGYVRKNTFVGKKFISDKKAHRVVLNLGFGTNSDTNPNILTGTTSETNSTALDLALGLGKEWRKGTTRLQGFYGADALITTSFSNSKTNETLDSDGSFVQNTDFKSGLDLGLGVQGFLGAEYFIFPKFAIGAQYTYRVGFTLNGASETTTKVGAGDPVTSNGEKNFSFAFGDLGSSTDVGFGILSINLTLHF